MAKALTPKILCVDDEPSILEAFKRQLRNSFDLDVAVMAKTALSMIVEKGPYGIVVSDMRMPEMDGIEFLKEVRRMSPDTVRLMLTGNSDQETAARAVNEGNIFRFLTKPCASDDLKKALMDAAQQYRLITAEKDLLQNTLSGSVKLLTDILSLIDPVSFGATMKLRDPIRNVAKELGIANPWDIELAVMLSNIGFVTVPSTVTAKLRKGISLSEQERELIQKIPTIGSSLISNIPRLEVVAQIVLYQNKHFDGAGYPVDSVSGEKIPIGARIVKVLKDLLQHEARGTPRVTALTKMTGRDGWYDPNILKAVIRLLGAEGMPAPSKEETKIYEVKSDQLFIGQTLLSNVETLDGVLLITAGTCITETLHERLVNYSKLVGIKEPIQVDCLIPTEE